MRNWITICFIFLGSYYSIAQLKTHTFFDIEEVMREEPRPLLVFLYTDWCGYCELMKRKTFTNKDVIDEINENYYLVFFNGESKEDVYFRNRKFSYKKKGIQSGTHELSESLATIKGNVAYPTLVILNPKYEIIYQKSSHLKARELLDVLKIIK